MNSVFLLITKVAWQRLFNFFLKSQPFSFLCCVHMPEHRCNQKITLGTHPHRASCMRHEAWSFIIYYCIREPGWLTQELLRTLLSPDPIPPLGCWYYRHILLCLVLCEFWGLELGPCACKADTFLIEPLCKKCREFEWLLALAMASLLIIIMMLF